MTERYPAVGVACGGAALWSVRATPGVSPSEETSPLPSRDVYSPLGRGPERRPAGHGRSLRMSPRVFQSPAPQGILDRTLSQPVPHV